MVVLVFYKMWQSHLLIDANVKYLLQESWHDVWAIEVCSTEDEARENASLVQGLNCQQENLSRGI